MCIKIPFESVRSLSPPRACSLKRRKDHYEIEASVEEQRGWFLVRWAGYHPSWEAWRTSGEVGSAVETWEQRWRLKKTEALRAWSG